MRITPCRCTVPAERMADALAFYGRVLGLEEIAQPARDRTEPGACTAVWRCGPDTAILACHREQVVERHQALRTSVRMRS